MTTRIRFRQILLRWYHAHKRDLPFRHTRDPYRIWISEVIFQQTRIGQGIDYYRRFVKRFPEVRTLAAASEREVLALWQGLGYYARARNLLAAARQIVSEHHGKFPREYEKIRKLKGIGDYSAAAIASVSFGLPYPAVDGNVMRFLARYAGMPLPVMSTQGKKAITEIASDLMDRNHPGDFNQALIEMGALQCIPANPDCGKCPFRKSCYAFTMDRVAALPVREKSAAPRSRYFNYLVISHQANPGPFYIRLREDDDIWKNLYDFPLIETPAVIAPEKLTDTREWKKIFGKRKAGILSASGIHRHVLSHQVIFARFIKVTIDGRSPMPYQLCRPGQVRKFPFPRLVDKYLNNPAG
ncbi:MAG TPA: A/G-specific adenine glycosylase [Bacteroidales bacterium]|nr:A/G-specific adenine glycosylase [Bacteroidales bacterium]